MKLATLLLLTLLVAACSGEHIPSDGGIPSNPGGGPGSPDGGGGNGGSGGTNGGGSNGNLGGTSVTYDIVATQVLQPKCTRCHQPGGRLLDLTTYEAIMGNPGLVTPGVPAQSSLFNAIAQNFMPPRSPLSDDLKALVAKWIEDGAQK